MQGGQDAAKSMSGQVAFDRAEVSAREAEVKTLASANAVADERLASAPPATGSRRRPRSGSPGGCS